MTLYGLRVRLTADFACCADMSRAVCCAAPAADPGGPRAAAPAQVWLRARGARRGGGRGAQGGHGARQRPAGHRTSQRLVPRINKLFNFFIDCCQLIKVQMDIYLDVNVLKSCFLIN